MDNYNIERFVKAQDGVWEDVLAELRDGYKCSHWMWYVFPQLGELGRTPIAKYYGISSKEEAAAYMEHPVLSARLREVCQTILDLTDIDDPVVIFGHTDARKLRSCMTLFHAAAPNEEVFAQVIDKFYAGRWDGRTLRILEQ